ncbi:hypothetical protein THAOC_15399, partial [Thalassiosira oceanica]
MAHGPLAVELIEKHCGVSHATTGIQETKDISQESSTPSEGLGVIEPNSEDTRTGYGTRGRERTGWSWSCQNKADGPRLTRQDAEDKRGGDSSSGCTPFNVSLCPSSPEQSWDEDEEWLFDESGAERPSFGADGVT